MDKNRIVVVASVAVALACVLGWWHARREAGGRTGATPALHAEVGAAKEPAGGDRPSGGLRILKRAIDGDTIILDGGERVRIIGIDAAELRRRERGRWVDITHPAPGAVEAYEWLCAHEGRKLRLSYGPQRQDEYGRTLAHVYLPEDGVDVACELLRRGWVRIMAIPPNTRRLRDWKRARDQGRKQRTAGERRR